MSYTDYKLDEIQTTVNAVNVDATFYAGDYQQVPDPDRPGETITRYVRSEILRSLPQQFPLGTAREEINDWYTQALHDGAGERTPLC